VLSWGCNRNNQIGVVDGPSPVLIPVEITNRFSLMPNEAIVSLASGRFHSILLTSQGRVFTWGDNTHGQLGTDDSDANFIEISTSFAN
jgi:alpha-tubulin suppressor-like RCC1 family protein